VCARARARVCGREFIVEEMETDKKFDYMRLKQNKRFSDIVFSFLAL